MLLGILNVRVIVNNRQIYPLPCKEPIVIEVADDHPQIVITDGFHYTKPMQLNYTGPGYYHFKVVCAIDNFQLIGNFFILTFFYLLGFITGVFILKLISFLPIVYLLIAYYLDRGAFLQIRQENR